MKQRDYMSTGERQRWEVRGSKWKLCEGTAEWRRRRKRRRVGDRGAVMADVCRQVELEPLQPCAPTHPHPHSSTPPPSLACSLICLTSSFVRGLPSGYGCQVMRETGLRNCWPSQAVHLHPSHPCPPSHSLPHTHAHTRVHVCCMSKWFVNSSSSCNISKISAAELTLKWSGLFCWLQSRITVYC